MSISSDAQIAVQNVAQTDRKGTEAVQQLLQEVQAEQKKLSSSQEFIQYENDVASDLKKAGLLPEVSLEYGTTLAVEGSVPKSLLNGIDSNPSEGPLFSQMIGNLDKVIGSNSSISTSDLSSDIAADRSYAFNRQQLAPLFQEHPVTEKNGKTTNQSLLEYIDRDGGGSGNGQITKQKLELYLKVAQSSIAETGMFSKSNQAYIKGLMANGVKLHNPDGTPYTMTVEQGSGDYSTGTCTGKIAEACHMTDYQLGDASASQRPADYAKMENEFNDRLASNKASVSKYQASDSSSGGGGGGTTSASQAVADTNKIENAPDTTLRNSSKTLMIGAIQAEYQRLQAGKISQSEYSTYLTDLSADLNSKGSNTLAGEVSENGVQAQQMGAKAAADAKIVQNALQSGDGTSASATLKNEINDAFQSVRNGTMSDAAYDEYVSDLGCDLGGYSVLAKEVHPDSVQGETIAREAASAAQETENLPGNKSQTLEEEIEKQYAQVQDGKMSDSDFQQYVSDLSSDFTNKHDDGLSADALQDAAALKSNSSTQRDSAIAQKAAADATAVGSSSDAPAVLNDVIQGAYDQVKDGTMTSAEFKSYYTDLSNDLKQDHHPDLAGNAIADGKACLNQTQAESAISQKAADDAVAVESSSDAPVVLKDVIDGAYAQVKDGSMTSAEFKSYVSGLSKDLAQAHHPDLSKNASADGAALEKTAGVDADAEKQVLAAANVQAGDGYWQVVERLAQLVTGNQNPSNAEIAQVCDELMSLDNATGSSTTYINQKLLDSSDWQKFLTDISQGGVPLNKTFSDAA